MPQTKTTKSRTAKKPGSTTKKKSAVVSSGATSQSFWQRNTMLLIVFAAFAIVGGVLATYLTHAASRDGAFMSAVAADKCLDNAGNHATIRNKIQLYNCNGTAAQQWKYTDSGTIVNANGFCLDVKGASKEPKTVAQLYTCNGTVAQVWKVNANGSIVNPNSGLCLDDKYAGTANGTQIWMWPCNNTVAQKWTIKAPATGGSGGGTTNPGTGSGSGSGGGTTTPSNPQNPGSGSSTSVSLFDPTKKEIAMQLVSSAENSSLSWKSQYGYIEDIGDSRGYTAGIIGFCTGCGDMVPLVEYYTKIQPTNVLSKYLPALKKIGSFNPTHAGLDPNFTKDWKTAAKDTKFQKAQNDERDRAYFNPAVNQGISDGLHALGQFIYYDAMVVHGPGNDSSSFGGIRAAALKTAKTPAQGGNETTYLNAFMDARNKAMKAEAAHEDVSRIENAQRVFLKAGNLNLNPPLKWSVYGDPYTIATNPQL